MFEIKNISIQVKERYLVKNLSFTVNQKDKLAIIGEEGNGKSTLLKALAGKLDYGEVTGGVSAKNHKIGYLEQSMSKEAEEQTPLEYLFQTEEDYYHNIGKFYKEKERFHITEEMLDRKIKTLSGGEKVKLAILKLLLEENDILLLDEPTNDLDIETLEWLENFINESENPILYVSHDETLLSRTSTMILHLEQIKHKTECRHTLLKEDYDTYVAERLAKLSKQTQLAKNEKRDWLAKEERLTKVLQKVEYQQETISRSNPHGGQLLKKKMHSLKSQEKKLDKIELTEIPDVEESINFFFEPVSLPKSKQILYLSLPELKVQNNILAQNIELEVTGSAHLCIIGNNGVGKSTLIKEIKKQLASRKDIVMGYMPQDYEEILKDYENVLDFIAQTKNKEEITKARMILGNMKFTREEMTGKISDLSNGSKAKLILTKLVLEKCDVLLLDEPTRNVSPLSNPVIRKALKEYNGCIISVSHDRKYIEEVIDTVYVLTKEGLKKKQ